MFPLLTSSLDVTLARQLLIRTVYRGGDQERLQGR